MNVLVDRVTAPLELQSGWLVPAARLHRVAFVLTRHGFGELATRVLTGRSEGDLTTYGY